VADSAALLAILRRHLGDCGRSRCRCPECDPAAAVYCPAVAEVAAAFAEARRREVFAGRLAGRSGG
jgi:hypothetical protein